MNPDSADGDVTHETKTSSKMTNKKMEYLSTEIYDKNGAYTYREDPVEYKRARKRQ